MALTPPTPTALPTKVAEKAVADSVVAANEAFWLGEIADQIIIEARAGKYTTSVSEYRVSSTNRTALTTAGYTVGTASGGLVLITWS